MSTNYIFSAFFCPTNTTLQHCRFYFWKCNLCKI